MSAKGPLFLRRIPAGTGNLTVWNIFAEMAASCNRLRVIFDGPTACPVEKRDWDDWLRPLLVARYSIR
jgi:hypothetical protein